MKKIYIVYLVEAITCCCAFGKELKVITQQSYSSYSIIYENI